MTTIESTRDGRGRAATNSPEVEMARQIQLALWHARPRQPDADRRGARRHPFPFPIRLVAVRKDGTSGEEFVVCGKNLSEQGIGFYHTEAIPERLVMATLDCGSSTVKLLVELRWCRFGSHGLFENGGRFLKVVHC